MRNKQTPNVSDDLRIIGDIANRATRLWASNGLHVPRLQVIATVDLVHRHVMLLQLRKLLEAQDHDFAHDVGGMLQHFDPVTHQLGGCFVPRFAAR